jgi:uncharacterized secreted protein with C-terminal beta-propeller domain
LIRHQSARFEQELLRRTEELKNTKSQVDILKRNLKELEADRLARVKLEVENSRMSETQQALLNKANMYEEQLEKQRQ